MTGTNGHEKHGADYKTTQRQVVNGKFWYQSGANQWISGDYAKIKNEASRGQKTFSNAMVVQPSLPQQNTNRNSSSNNSSDKRNPKDWYTEEE